MARQFRRAVAKRNGVNHIVHLGVFTRDHDAYSTVFAWHQMIEAYVRVSGVSWTNLHPNMFMQNFLSVWSIKGGVYSAYTSPAYAKGGFELFRQVEDGRMAYIGSVLDDTKRLLSREPLLLKDWAKLHANELLEAAGRESGVGS